MLHPHHLIKDKNSCGAGENFSLKCILIEYNTPNLSLICICVYHDILNPTLKSGFPYKIIFFLSVVLYFGIRALYFTIYVLDSDLVWRM